MHSITNNDITIFYRTAGNKNKPALIMLHGFGNNSQNWFDLGYVDILKQHFFLIMPDARGCGDSDKPLTPEAYQLETFAQDALLILDKENIDKAHLYGSSIGALQAGYLATHYPGRFLSFIMQGLSPFNVMEIKTVLADILKQTKGDGIVAYVDVLANMFNTTFPPSIRKAMEQCDPEALYAYSIAKWDDQTDRFPNIKQPCLLIIGEHEGITDDMKEAVKLIPNCELAIIPGLDHAHTYWAGEQVAPIIVDFLEKTEID
jgi:pimeloyl-ACP methyl ester carboxylesterase